MPSNDTAPERRRRIVVQTAEVLGSRMAGPAIRAFRIAEALSSAHDVRLVSEVRAELEHDDFEILRAGGAELVEHVAWADVLVLQSPILTLLPEILDTGVVIVADLYDPYLFEELQQLVSLDGAQHVIDGAGGAGTGSARRTVEFFNESLRHGDYFICASERQRDLWIGNLVALGRVNERTYLRDPTLRDLIEVVPFGVDDTAAVQVRHAIKGRFAGISETDKVLIWGGGIYDWFDPLTLIRAVHDLSARRDDLRLFFLSTTHPNPDVPASRRVAEAVALATELGALDRTVFFNNEWVQHDERADYLLDADIGVSTHLDNLETAYSFRTRLLDYLWAGLPIVSTSGDAFERTIIDHHLGVVVPPLDTGALADALEDLLYGDADGMPDGEHVRRYAASRGWDQALEPLVRFCAAPRHAADHTEPTSPRAGRAADPAASADEARVVALETRIRELEASSSWRVTAPLRWASSHAGRWSSRRRGARPADADRAP